MWKNSKGKNARLEGKVKCKSCQRTSNLNSKLQWTDMNATATISDHIIIPLACLIKIQLVLTKQITRNNFVCQHKREDE